jgi:dihydroneopterin triphosphate diphosphatase
VRQPTSALIHPVTYIGKEWKFLLLKRVAMPQYGLPIFWQGISGGVEDNESVEEAAERELMEETKFTGVPLIRVVFIRAIPMQEEWKKQYLPGTKEIIEHTFVCILNGTFEPTLSWEHTEFAWLSYMDALEKLYYDGNKVSLEAVYEWLKKRDRP